MRSNCLIVRAHPAWYGVCGGSSGMRPEECSVDSLVEGRPELAPGARDKGIGGGAVKVAARIAPGDEPLGRVVRGNELERLAESVKEQGDNLRALDRLMARAGKALAALPSRWPVRGGVNSEFGNRVSPWTRVTEFHSGLDINAQPRTPVRAPAGGTVFFAGAQPEDGNTVILDHALA